MNIRDVGSKTSVNESVQTNKMINKRLICSTTTPKKDVKIYGEFKYCNAHAYMCNIHVYTEITDADEACLSSEISVNLTIIIAFFFT
jgi:hypothetical protein